MDAIILVFTVKYMSSIREYTLTILCYLPISHKPAVPTPTLTTPTPTLCEWGIPLKSDYEFSTQLTAECS